MKPTDEQIKEFWEWCGCEYYEHQDGDATPFIRLPDGEISGGWSLPIDLNNLFKYAVPKVKWYLMSDWGAEHIVHIYTHTSNNAEDDVCKEYSAMGEDPALALFWAIYRVIK